MNAPILVAHRGYPARYPENTLEGVTAAINAGARYIEFDVQLSADQVPLVVHDDNLCRTTGQDIAIWQHPAATLCRIPAGEAGRFGELFAEVTIPTLADMAELIRGHSKVQAFVELKQSSLLRFGRQIMLDAVMQAIEPIREQCIIISFDRKVVEEVKRQGSCRCGWALRSLRNRALRLAEIVSPDFVFFNARLLWTSTAPLPAAPWEWVVYTIDDKERAMQLVARGIRFVETDNIGNMLAV